MIKLVYTTDVDGKDILQDESGKHQVMMAWEKNYMEKCVDVLDPRGRVLEIGYGLGYSASRIQMFPDVTEHVIIECSPEVWDHMAPFLEEHPKATLVKGRWQDVAHTLGKFDSVFFDDYTFDSREADRATEFLRGIIPQMGARGRIGTYAMRRPPIEIPGVDVFVEQVEVSIPPHCRYAQGDNMYASRLELSGPVDLRPQCPPPMHLMDSIDRAYSARNMPILEALSRELLEAHPRLRTRHNTCAKFYLAYALFSSKPDESARLFEEVVAAPYLANGITDNARSNLAALLSRDVQNIGPQ